MEFKGGAAGLNSVMFQSNSYYVKAINQKNSQIKIVINQVPEKRKNSTDILYEIPFVRGLWLIIDNILYQWKLSIALVLIGTLITLLTTYFSSMELNTVSNNVNKVSIVIQSFILLFAFKITDLGKYHAAEHMVANAYDKGKELTIENVSKLSRIHNSCGTNLVVFILSTIGLLNAFGVNILLTLPLGISIAYEIFRVKEGIVSKLVKPFYWVGSIAQYVLFTSKPKEKHIEVALISFTKLQELESNQ